MDTRTSIDCKEFFVQSMAKKVTSAKKSEIASPKFSIQHTSSIIWNEEAISAQSKRHPWRRLLTRDSYQ